MSEPCRVCLGSKSVVDMNTVFVGGQSITTIFSECLGLEVEMTEPAFLCEVCKMKLLEFNGFRKLAALNSQYFQTKTIKNESDAYNENIFEDQCIVINPEVKIEEEVQGKYDPGLGEDNNYSDYVQTDDGESSSESESAGSNIPESKPKPERKFTRGPYKKKPKPPQDITDDMVRCAMCPKFFDTPSKVYRHMREHELEYGGIWCHFCGKHFEPGKPNNRKMCQMHIKAVHLKNEDEKFECDICGALFAQKGSIRVHKKFVHERHPGNFICHICSKPFRDKYKLSTHIRVTHDKILYHKCPECGRLFGNNTSVKNHMITVHSAEKMFTCQFCGKKFASASNKITHEKLHTATKILQCEHCDYTTPIPTNLRIHKKRHTKRPTYKCSFCGQEFTSKGGLKFHEEGHREVTYPCPVCKNVYRHKGSLQDHISAVHQNEGFNCPVCQKSFVRRDSVRRHLRKVHNQHPRAHGNSHNLASTQSDSHTSQN